MGEGWGGGGGGGGGGGEGDNNYRSYVTMSSVPMAQSPFEWTRKNNNVRFKAQTCVTMAQN